MPLRPTHLRPTHLRIVTAAVLLLAATAVSSAWANEMERVPPVTHAATQKECGECHMAFHRSLTDEAFDPDPPNGALRCRC
ncbi:hypothetical protein [Azospirillum sp. TSO22-1]|uniref:hypothetical protein n=1 Tax=Azospirillum sp. TSO22-1 TaxID=716789 RepID=UPI000D609915|nr:hypothetical protein [Azospirillum sp. TSO22-1]PWC31995.1 hypothetical protein TSO221_31900 [Azospirillum sp. TSO22-1]